MHRATAWTVHLAVLATAVSGGILAWSIYFATEDEPQARIDPEEEFADLAAEFAVQDPWQVWATPAHVLAAPVCLFAVGLIWRAHVWPRIRHGSRPRRRTGLALAALFLPLALAGYLLQVLLAEDARHWTSILHACLGGLFASAYLVHQIPRRSRGRSGGDATPP